MSNVRKKRLSPEQREELIRVLKSRFEKNMNRHQDLEWAKIQAKLEANPEKLWSLGEMERTGGEPDIVGFDEKKGEYGSFRRYHHKTYPADLQKTLLPRRKSATRY